MTLLARVVLLCSLLLAGCAPISAERHQTPTPDAEAAARATAIAAVMAGSQPAIETFRSPDGQWRAEIVMYGCVATAGIESGEMTEYAYELLRLAPSDAGDWRQVDSQLLDCGGLGAYGLGGLCWSPDSRYFYYTTAREGVPDGAGKWTPPVWQLEAATGAVGEIDEAAADTGENLVSCGTLQRYPIVTYRYLLRSQEGMNTYALPCNCNSWRQDRHRHSGSR